jgi:hypothetical protein
MTRGVELASDCFLCLSRNKKNKKSIWIHHSHIMRDAIFIIIVCAARQYMQSFFFYNPGIRVSLRTPRLFLGSTEHPASPVDR